MVRLSITPQGEFSPLSTVRKASASVIGSRERHSTTRTPNAGCTLVLVTLPVSTTLWLSFEPVVRNPVNSTVSWGRVACARAGGAGATSTTVTVTNQASASASLA